MLLSQEINRRNEPGCRDCRTNKVFDVSTQKLRCRDSAVYLFSVVAQEINQRNKPSCRDCAGRCKRAWLGWPLISRLGAAPGPWATVPTRQEIRKSTISCVFGFSLGGGWRTGGRRLRWDPRRNAAGIPQYPPDL